MSRIQSPLARVYAAFGRGYRRWRMEQFMPSVLFDLNRSLAEDVAIVPEHGGEAIPPRRRRQ
jgi:hypothetical protein